MRLCVVCDVYRSKTHFYQYLQRKSAEKIVFLQRVSDINNRKTMQQLIWAEFILKKYISSESVVT